MMLIVSGVMDSNGEVEVVFSSFPALLFYVIYSIIVLRWYVKELLNKYTHSPTVNRAEIYHSRLKLVSEEVSRNSNLPSLP